MPVTTPPSSHLSTPILLGLLTLAVAVIGTRVSCLEFEGNQLDRKRNQLEAARKEPAVELYVENWSVFKHTEAINVEAIVEELAHIEAEYRQYSGRHIIVAQYDLERVDGKAPTLDSLRSVLDGISLGTEALELDRRQSVPRLLKELGEIRSTWQNEAVVSSSMVDQLEDLEDRYYSFTGGHVLALKAALEAALDGRNDRGQEGISLSRALSRLDDVSSAIEDEQPFDEPGFETLRERIEALKRTHTEGKEGQRLLVEVIAENQSQLATVIRREALAELSHTAGSSRVDLAANSDWNLGPYSADSMRFVSSNLNASQVAFVAEYGEDLGVKLVVLDLRDGDWVGVHSPARHGARAELLAKALERDVPQ